MPTFFEDLRAGETASLGSYRVTAEEIVSFAERYDPQPLHTDPERAADSMYGGLIASGWHTAAMTMRLVVEEYLAGLETLGAKGIDELRWTRPVRPGDELSVRTEVLEKRPDSDDRGTVRVLVETLRGDETVMRCEPLIMVARGGD